jgi:hypothetical protein
MIKPKRFKYSNHISSRFSYQINKTISFRCKRILSDLFKSIIQGEIQSDDKRGDLYYSEEFSTFDYFELLKGKFHNSIFKEDV